MARMEASTHLLAFSSLLARDPDAGRLNIRDLQILTMIVDAGHPISGVDVARTVKISGSQVTKVVDRLELHGLIRRGRTKEDRRLVTLSPTDQGRDLDRRIRAYFQAAKPHAAEAAA